MISELDIKRLKKKTLEDADALYWAGKERTMTDENYDRLSAETGHICKPPRDLKGWAQYPDCALIRPNYGLKKVGWEIARHAIRHWPKWDGIFVQGWFGHLVTRGDGRIGKDLTGKLILLRFLFRADDFKDVDFKNFELCYKKEDGGRVALCRDLSKGSLKLSADLIPHNEGSFDGEPPRAIPDQIEGWPVDGWVIQLANGQKFAYKGEVL